ncbi:ABC transporter substrate-binding protein [uncultured Alsobacter sp.]|uniref:ABC transporter substrate-binding protein n=1 Tax=uncultured Alsobacter sp. TaxID=1748258 RepID=UPI0025FA9638|nr:ABC transporter substrate-binding protein [uncultured Alsobacter sp.]
MARWSVSGSLRTLLVSSALALAAGPAFAQANLVIAFPANQEPAQLDGHIDPYQSTWLLNSFIADPLVILDSDGSYKPALATSWESSPDGKVWTFKLRSGVTFQDGTPFDAAAVKYNLERINDPKTASAQLKSDVGPWKSVEVVDPTTVKITYDTPWVTLLDALRRTPIWSPTAAEKFGLANFSKNLVGAGPFTLAEWVPNDRIVFKKWAGYGGWNPVQKAKGPVGVDQVTVRWIGEGAVLGNVVKSGNAQIGFTIPASFVDEYKNDKTVQFISKDQSGTGLQMVMNTRKPPLNDVRVRRALHHAADQAAINKLLYDGYYAPSEGPLNNNHRCFWDGAGKMYERSADKAKALLEQAGWKAVSGKPIREAQGVAGVPDGTPLKIRYNVLHHKEIGEALQAQMRRAGIDLAVEVVAGPVQLDRVRKADFELMYERQRSPDPLILDQVWNSKWDQPGGWAWTGFKDDTLDTTLNKLRALPSIDERCAAARDAQKIIMENALMLPTLSDPVFVAVSGKVKGFQMGAEGNWFFLNNVTLDK